MEAYTVKIEAFEGPFDLLFHLIEKNKIDIYDIPISVITDQYLDYIAAMREMDLDIASEFLVMASTLLHIKSRLLLPAPSDGREDEGDDPRDELVVSMLEYKKYKEITDALRENASYWGGAHYRPAGIDDASSANADIEIDAGNNLSSNVTGLFDVDRDKLISVYRRLIELNMRSREYVGAKVKKIIEREQITIALKIKEISHYLAVKRRFLFQKLFNKASVSRLNMLTAFIALLELAQQNRLSLRQKGQFGALMVSRKSKGAA